MASAEQHHPTLHRGRDHGTARDTTAQHHVLDPRAENTTRAPTVAAGFSRLGASQNALVMPALQLLESFDIVGTTSHVNELVWSFAARVGMFIEPTALLGALNQSSGSAAAAVADGRGGSDGPGMRSGRSNASHSGGGRHGGGHGSSHGGGLHGGGGSGRAAAGGGIGGSSSNGSSSGGRAHGSASIGLLVPSPAVDAHVRCNPTPPRLGITLDMLPEETLVELDLRSRCDLPLYEAALVRQAVEMRLTARLARVAYPQLGALAQPLGSRQQPRLPQEVEGLIARTKADLAAKRQPFRTTLTCKSSKG